MTLLVPPSALAAFPERDFTLVVPWAAGGGTDTLARTLAKNAKQYFGVNMSVVNRVGGTGVVGMNSVAMSRPDGYTKLMDSLALPRTYMRHDTFLEFLIGMEKSLEPVLDSVGLLKKK